MMTNYLEEMGQIIMANMPSPEYTVRFITFLALVIVCYVAGYTRGKEVTRRTRKLNMEQRHEERQKQHKTAKKKNYEVKKKVELAEAH